MCDWASDQSCAQSQDSNARSNPQHDRNNHAAERNGTPNTSITGKLYRHFCDKAVLSVAKSDFLGYTWMSCRCVLGAMMTAGDDDEPITGLRRVGPAWRLYAGVTEEGSCR